MAKLKTGRHTSAIKAQRMAERRARHNRTMRKAAHESVKGLLAVATAKDKAKTQELYRKASSSLDKAAKSGALHWKTAARKKSRLARAAAKLLAAQAVEKKAPTPAQP